MLFGTGRKTGSNAAQRGVADTQNTHTRLTRRLAGRLDGWRTGTPEAGTFRRPIARPAVGASAVRQPRSSSSRHGATTGTTIWRKGASQQNTKQRRKMRRRKKKNTERRMNNDKKRIEKATRAPCLVRWLYVLYVSMCFLIVLRGGDSSAAASAAPLKRLTRRSARFAFSRCACRLLSPIPSTH